MLNATGTATNENYTGTNINHLVRGCNSLRGLFNDKHWPPLNGKSTNHG